MSEIWPFSHFLAFCQQRNAYHQINCVKLMKNGKKNAKVTIFIKGKMLSGFKNHQFAGTTREWNFTKI